MKKILAVAAAAAMTIGLSSCAGQPEEPAPTQTEKSDPALLVPDMTYGQSAKLKINTGNLERGTVLTVYSFPVGWDKAKEVDCSNPDAEKTQYTVAGEGVESVVSLRVNMGYNAFVMAGPGFTTECGGEGSMTLRKIEPDLGITLSEGSEDSTVKPGKETEVTVLASGLYESEGATKFPAEVHVNGPYDSIPEATAATCENPKVAMREEVEIKPGIRSNNVRTKIKIPQTGVYFLSVSTDETDVTAAYDSCQVQEKKFITVK